MNPSKYSWEDRYRSLENTFEQALIYLSNLKPSGVRIFQISSTISKQKAELVVVTEGAPARFAYWIYKNNKLQKKVPYTDKNSVTLNLIDGARYRIRVFVASWDGTEAACHEDYVIESRAK